MNDEEIKMKKDEISKITNELKSHIYVEEFFVDPEKKFMSLLEKIIKFFEEDDFVMHIRQNEHLHETFKKKYDSAVDLIKTIEEEKDKLQLNLKKMSNNHNYLCSRKVSGSYYDGEDSPINLSRAEMEESPRANNDKRNQRGNSEFNLYNMNRDGEIDDSINQSVDHGHSNTCNHNHNPQYQAQGQIKIEFEKLKEDYFNIYEEKKYLEQQLADYINYKSQYSEIKNTLLNLQIQFDSNTIKSQLYYEEKNSLSERLNKTMKENYELVQNIGALRESLNISERERNDTRTKSTGINNKIKMLEKEITSLRKKNQNLNLQVKDLKEIVKDETDEKLLLEKKFDDVVQEMENKIAIIEIEKQKILKDSMTHLIDVISEDRCIEFVYNRENNKIEIFFDNSKIADVDNKGDNNNNKKNNNNNNNTVDDVEDVIDDDDDVDIDNKCDFDLEVNKNNSNNNLSNNNTNIIQEGIINTLTTENSILYLKTDNTYEASTPSKWKTNKNNARVLRIYSDAEEAEQKQIENFSLTKLFSKSISSKKSSSFKNDNKENFNFANGNNISSPNKMQQLSQKKILISNLSSAKKNQRNEFSKLERGCLTVTNANSQQEINPFNFNPSLVDNCIRKTNLNLNNYRNFNYMSQSMNNNLRYVLSSNNRHKKVISLDEAMGEEIIEEQESVLVCTAKKLNFFSVSSMNFDISKSETEKKKSKRENKIFEISNFDLKIENNKKDIEIEKEIFIINDIIETKEVVNPKEELTMNEIKFENENDFFSFKETYPKDSVVYFTKEDNDTIDHYESVLISYKNKKSELRNLSKCLKPEDKRQLVQGKEKSECFKCMIL